ncbi:hypothetical protein UFOVP163_34 [uncultured Caudovirales phage]|uniref:Uncharacterized protein n=1 Tax=uncultured Caudovirales phage TaxID=2100421 RepID=A0A6J7W9U0_9CAUD|nr:hypothetical protein UFOVP163_34 [uncultured Caudovirales phage]
MACILSKGIKLDCSNNTGGVEAIWITAIDDIATLTVNEVDGAPASGDGTVTALTMDASKSFLKFETLRNSISFEQPSSINLENGSTFYTHTIQFQIPKQDVTKRNKIYQLAAGQQKVLVIVKDMNGQYWLSGVQSDGSTAVALQVSVANAMSGKAKGDMNGYDVTLTAELNSLAFSVSSTIATAVIADGDSTWA